jgi:hypothetical protein
VADRKGQAWFDATAGNECLSKSAVWKELPSEIEDVAKIPAMQVPEIPELFACEYIAFSATLDDGRRLNWTHWVPNIAVDKRFGVTPDEEYVTADIFADEKSKGYMLHGIHVRWDGGTEEYIAPAKVVQVSTVVERKHLALPEILMREAHLRAPQNLQVHPPRKRLSLQETIGAIDDLLIGNATLNELFSKLRLPKRNEVEANWLLKATEQGYESISSGAPLDIRTLFPDDLLYQIVEIRRIQVLQGIA